VPGVGVAVAVEEELARTCAVATDVEALAVLREAMPKASPARPASATATKSSLVAVRLIIFS